MLAFYKRKLEDVLQRVAALKTERTGASNAGATGGGARLDALTDKLRDLACEIQCFHCMLHCNGMRYLETGQSAKLCSMQR